MKVKSGVYKMKTGSTLPTKGPIIKIYAEGSSTKYSHVANTHTTFPVLVKYTASCSNKGKLTGGSVAIGNAKTSIDSGSGFSSHSVWVNVPYSAIKKINPSEHCNTYAKTLSLEKNQPLEKIVQKGFTMKIPNVLSAKGTAYCTAAGLGKGDVASGSTDNLGVFLHCVANSKARSPRKTTKTTAPKPDTGKTTTNFESAKLSVRKPNYIGKCPVGMKFDGTITANAKGKIEYQIIGDGNYSTPLKTLAFTKAGTKTFQWTRMVRKPDTSSQITMGGQAKDPNVIAGWMRLKVIYKLRNNIASTKKTWLSKRQNFRVTCGKTVMRAVQ